ncbi:hypothetical protein FHS89_002457 [Rubricella aquisinus]|uniref:Lipoprotein n=1 Tax=Rubricella aquisinus TaxID=2028108 RepID=A0A840X3P4_9RHOB|nr:hypothetical protein [Rubricella aquisinus]MBB5516426.1 hypothetical protein [Rubricella aquisinus]
MKISQFLLCSCCFVVVACAPVQNDRRPLERPADPAALFDPAYRLYIADARGALVSDDPDMIADVAQAATRPSLMDLATRRDTDRVSIRQVPFLFESPEGQSYLLADGAKALVRATPAESCPVSVQLQIKGPGAALQDAVEAALTICHEKLAQRDSEADCGCEVLAQGDLLRTSLEAFDYVRDYPARLFRNGRLDPLRYLARETVAEDGTLGFVLTGPQGPEMLLEYQDGAGVTATFPDGSEASGTTDRSGLSRGRYIEVITLNTEDGQIRISLGP